MKTILFAFTLLFSSVASAETSSQEITIDEATYETQHVPQMTGKVRFVSPNGCIWKETGGRCMVENIFTIPILCDVTVRLTTERIPKGVVRTARVTVPGQMYDDSIRFKPAEGDKITGVQVRAFCEVKPKSKQR